MKLLVIFTGGTIGSTAKADNYIGTDDNKPYILLQSYRDKYSDAEITFDTISPYTILSENLNGEHINCLSQCITKNQSSYDGIIITHGTDTLQYTAAGLTLLNNSLQIPVVLVSSNYVLEDARANGLLNFAAAIEFIKEGISGVFVAYNNGEDKTYIHSGARLLPHAPYSDKIYSLDDKYVGYIDKNIFYSGAIRDDKSLVIEDLPGALASEYSCTSNILCIDEHPGNDYFLPSEETKAVLINSYHSGTICTDNKKLDTFLSYCKQKNIPVYLLGIEDRIQYESTKYYTDKNIIILPKMSAVFAYMYLWLQFS